MPKRSVIENRYPTRGRKVMSVVVGRSKVSVMFELPRCTWIDPDVLTISKSTCIGSLAERHSSFTRLRGSKRQAR
jgi:hypothetical protein